MTRAVFLLAPIAVGAQLIIPGEAETPEEYDAWLDAKSAVTLAQAKRNAGEFERRWPQSKLSAGLQQRVMELAIPAGDVPAAVEAAERALRAIPTYLPALLLLAEYGSQAARREERLALARQVFTHYPPPPGLVIAEWRPIRAKWGAKLDELEGLAAWARSDPAEAERLLKRAVASDASNARAWLRLARVLRAKKDEAGAGTAYREAAARGDAAIKALVDRELIAR